MATRRLPGAIRPGQVWRQRRSGRNVVILAAEVYGTGPSWRYEDEPDGWHYSDAFAFLLWDDYEFIRD